MNVTKLDLIDDRIYAVGTDRQKQIVDQCRKSESLYDAADALKVHYSTIQSALTGLLKRAANQHGIVPNMPEMPLAEGKALGKITTQVNARGEVIQAWYRQSDEDLEAITEAIENACATVEPLPSKKPKGMIQYCKDIIPFFNIGDGHLGMLSYRKEVGHDFDLDIAIRDLWSAMQILIDEAPTTERCVIQDMGDMTHYENEQGTTEASGHMLDCDGRYSKMINCYVDTMIYIVNYALTKFKYVDVIINQGNHSRKNDIWMNIFLKRLYSLEKRVTIIDNDSVFIPYRMGNTFVMCHHSDKCRPQRLGQVMATDYRHDFGEALYKYIDIGHVHHHMVSKEYPSVTVESFNQLATSDKYANDGGWRSRSCLTVVYRSKTYGEVGRMTLPLERVRDIIFNAPAGTEANKRREVYTVE